MIVCFRRLYGQTARGARELAEKCREGNLRVAIESAAFGVVGAAFVITLSTGAGIADIAAATSGQMSSAIGDRHEDNVYARLPAYPAPFTEEERRVVRATLAEADATLARVRASTDSTVSHMSRLSESDLPPR